MPTTLDGLHHVKLPVRDVAVSSAWYSQVLGLETEIEFVEDGVLRGVAMRDAARTVCLALRHDPARAEALAGFDPLAWGTADRQSLDDVCAHLDRLGEPHGEVVPGHEGWVLLGLHDPNGLEVRLYTTSPAQPAPTAAAAPPGAATT